MTYNVFSGTLNSTQSISRFSTDDSKVFLYFTMGRPFPLKIAHFHGDLDSV